jgi:outer membrane protein OmpA-like peptidoglycan-associated protein
LTSSAVSAAGGAPTITRSTTTSPSGLAGANANRMLRLEKSNSFLVLGRKTSVAGSSYHVWKMKEDLTFDSTFGVKDLGASFSVPTSSNSNCAAGGGTNCSNIQSFSVNEAADTFFVAYSRTLKGSGSSSGSDATIMSLLTGKISTGAVIAQSMYFEPMGSPALAASMSDWSSYSTTELGRPACTAGVGASVSSVPLVYAFLYYYQTIIRFDGSIVVNTSCTYNNTNNWPTTPTAAKEYISDVMFSLKPANGSFTVDTSFGTSGYTKVSTAATECSNLTMATTSDTSISSMSSTKTAFLVQKMVRTRTTTIPSHLQSNSNITSYDGCSNYGAGVTQTLSIASLQINGTVKKTVTYPADKNFNTSRWIIDPQGRWNAIVTMMPVNGGMPSSTPTLVRLTADGSQDTSIGANGIKNLTGLPSTVSVNGTTVQMRYSVSGLATTANGTYFVGFATSGYSNCNTQVGSYTSSSYPYYFSLETGIISSYGTNGIGTPFTAEINNAGACSSETSLGSASFINSEGRPVRVIELASIGSQTAGLAYAIWDSADGVTGGGDGSISAASTAGRVDKKVYSTKLPTVAQPDSALTVLTAKQAQDLDIRTSTPKICIALTTSVMLVNPGRCVVRIIDEDTKKVLRTMTTTVKKSEVEQGTTLTTDEPIMFKQASIKLSKQAQAQVAELAEAAKSASRIVVIGHSAALGEVSAYSYAISRDRALAVKAALVKAGVKATIEIVALSYSQPESTKKTEAAQAKNRRAEVFLFP